MTRMEVGVLIFAIGLVIGFVSSAGALAASPAIFPSDGSPEHRLHARYTSDTTPFRSTTTIATAGFSNQITNPDWPMFGADPAHTGHINTDGPTNGITERWHVSDDGTFGSPVVVDGTVYVASGSRGVGPAVHALDAKTGTFLWNFSVDGTAFADMAAAVVGGTVYVSLSGTFNTPNRLYALDAATGTELWNTSVAGHITSPVVVGGTVYVGSHVPATAFNNDGRVYAFDAATGAEQWTFTTDDVVRGTPAVDGGTVYVGSADDKVYALDAATGAEQWNFTTGGNVDGPPAVDGGTVYVGSGDAKVYALDATTGAVQWSFTTGHNVVTSPAVVGGTVYVGSLDDRMYALDAATGAEQWNVTTGDDIRSSPAVVDGTVYFGSNDANVYALDAATGAEQWNFTTGAIVIESSPAVVNGTVYIGIDETLYALTEPTPAGGDTTAPTIANAQATDADDGDGKVAGGDTIAVSAEVTDAGTGVDTVIANASAFGAGNVTLTDADADDTYNATVTVDGSQAASDGSHTLQIVANDSAGNTNEMATNALTLDTTPPTITNAQATDLTDGDGEVGDGDSIEISADVTDAGTGVDTVGADASAFGAGSVTLTNSGGTYDATITVDANRAAADGSYAITIAANDTVNNTNTASTNTLALNTTSAQTVSPGLAGFEMGVAVVALILVTLIAIRRHE